MPFSSSITGRTDLRLDEVQLPKITSTSCTVRSSRAFSAKSGQSEAGRRRRPPASCPAGRPRSPCVLLPSISISMVSFSVVSEIAIVHHPRGQRVQHADSTTSPPGCRSLRSGTSRRTCRAFQPTSFAAKRCSFCVGGRSTWPSSPTPRPTAPWRFSPPRRSASPSSPRRDWGRGGGAGRPVGPGARARVLPPEGTGSRTAISHASAATRWRKAGHERRRTASTAGDGNRGAHSCIFPRTVFDGPDRGGAWCRFDRCGTVQISVLRLAGHPLSRPAQGLLRHLERRLNAQA
jgi:hypothetical protein